MITIEAVFFNVAQLAAEKQPGVVSSLLGSVAEIIMAWAWMLCESNVIILLGILREHCCYHYSSRVQKRL